MMHTLSLAVLLAASVCADTQTACITLLDPTSWDGPALVEVPTGRIAAPGLVDWSNVRLFAGKHEIPFSIREGRAHWRARLSIPGSTPLPEDLLVFWYAVSGEKVEIHLEPGPRKPKTFVTHTEEGICINYDHVKAVLDERSGLLTDLRVHGESLLEDAMHATCLRIGEKGYEISGNVGPGYLPQSIQFEAAETVSYHARLAAIDSTKCMTEVHFVLEAPECPAMGLSYRIHAAGLLEIAADERPWTGESPWLNHAATFSLPLTGDWESLPFQEGRLPFYGFKDYAAVVKQTARHGTTEKMEWIELGEEAVNGRCWLRRVYAFPKNSGTMENALEMLDEGLVIDVRPVSAALSKEEVFRTAYPPEAATVARLLEEVLASQGLTVSSTSEGVSPRTIALTLLEKEQAGGLEPDGFEIRACPPGDFELRACTLLGLYQAVNAVKEHLAAHGADAGFPLIARNPVVPIRGGGFGGGNFEVDFPYGDDAEWERVLGHLLDSGMNIFWCLGMWSNWKLPVEYKYMPELRSSAPDAYDESSGALFSEFAAQRDHGLKLMHFLQERGGKVYVWLPIGCVPTTFAEHYPEAIMPGSIKEFWGRPKGTPCFTHPAYRAYVDAFLRELLELYPLDGVVMVRDDNGGVCTCERCAAYVAESRTKNAVWEQYMLIYDGLRQHGFTGAIGVYPYFDGYTPALEPLLPEDLFIGGHGASTALLCRRQDCIGHMPDTWLDSLYTNFRLPSSPSVRRLLSNRGSFWIGGAYTGTELPWEGIGFFGWEPTATPNSFRYQWGARTFGRTFANISLGLCRAYEDLWDINARYMLPGAWMKCTPEERKNISDKAAESLYSYNAYLDMFWLAKDVKTDADWSGHMGLFSTFVQYHLKRLNNFSEICALVQEHEYEIGVGERLPEGIRRVIVDKYTEIYQWAKIYGNDLEKVPCDMLAHTQRMTLPYKEWMSGWDTWLDPMLKRPQFAGELHATSLDAQAGKPFVLRVELVNTGICPWIAQAGQRLELTNLPEGLSLPEAWTFTGEAMVTGDHRVIELKGTAPAAPGAADVGLAFYSPSRVPSKCAETSVSLLWE